MHFNKFPERQEIEKTEVRGGMKCQCRGAVIEGLCLSLVIFEETNNYDIMFLIPNGKYSSRYLRTRERGEYKTLWQLFVM